MYNIYVMGIQDEKKGKGKEKIFETTMVANFPKLMSDTKPQVWEAWRPQSRKIMTKLHRGISLSNYRKSDVKNKILTEARGENNLTYRGIR